MSELEDEIEILKGEIRKRDKIIDDLRLELAECRGRVKELRSENRSLQDEVNRLSVLKLDLKLRDVQRLEDENNRLEHRIEITKGLLDEARNVLMSLKGSLRNSDARASPTGLGAESLKASSTMMKGSENRPC